MPKLKIRVPLAIKSFLICTGLTVSVALVGGFVVYRGACYSLRQEVRERLMDTARTAALQVDPALHSQILTSKDESSPAYKSIKAQLIRIKAANPDIRYVYTVRRSSKPNELEFVVDAEQNPKTLSHVGDLYDVSKCPEMKYGLIHPAADQTPIEDHWGTWLSGYAPIHDKNGRPIGAIGLDMSINQLHREEAALRSTAIQTLIVAFALSMAFSLLITRIILRKVGIFSRAAQRVRNGDLDFRIEPRSSDEIGELAMTFNQMLVGLKHTAKDLLTGLYNHRHFQECLTAELERARRYDHKMTLMIIDLDRFRSVNDKIGHPAGDSILQQVGSLIKGNLRNVDIIARYGADKFAVILPETGITRGLEVAERLRSLVEATTFFPILEQAGKSPVQDRSKGANLTITAGLCGFPEHHSTRDGLLMSADIALIWAKHASRNSVRVYDPSICDDRQVDPHDIYQMLRNPNLAAIESLSAAVEAKDRYTCGHSERVTQYALVIGRALNLDDQALDGLKVAGLLHDLGKIGVPDALLNKSGTLTQEERLEIQLHPSIAESILRRTPQFDWVIPAIRFHHEKWDGTGYPNGLSGEDIPLYARILAIADAFDAMTSDRPYRKALSATSALQELTEQAGKQFDPYLVELFVNEMWDDNTQAQAA